MMSLPPILARKSRVLWWIPYYRVQCDGGPVQTMAAFHTEYIAAAIAYLAAVGKTL